MAVTTLSQQQKRDVGASIGREQNSLRLLQQRRSYMQSRGETLTDIDREIQRTQDSLRAKQERYGQEQFSEAAALAPKNYNRARGVGSSQELRTAREKTRQGFISRKEQEAISQGANYQTATGEFYQVTTTTTGQRQEALQPPTQGAAGITDFLATRGTFGTGFAASRVGYSQDALPVDPLKNRPQYSSAVGFSTNEGFTEMFAAQPQQKKASRTPTFSEKRTGDIERFQRALRAAEQPNPPRNAQRNLAEATFLPLVEVPGLAVERSSMFVQERLPKAYTTTPVPFAFRYTESVGRRMRTEPTQVSKEIVLSTAGGLAVGGLVGYGLGRYAAVKGVGKALQAERYINIGGGALGAGLVGATAYTGGAEGLAGITPGFVGFSLGYAGGYAKMGGGVSLTTMQPRITTEFSSKISDTGLLRARASGKGEAIGTAFGQPFKAPTTFSASFTATPLESGIFRGVGRATTRVSVGNREFVYRNRFSGVFQGGKNNVFVAQPRGGDVFTSVVGTPQASVNDISLYPTTTFKTRNGALLEVRKGAVQAEQFSSPLMVFSRPTAVSAAGGFLFVGSPLTQVGTELVTFGSSSTVETTTVLGRGSRGRLARGFSALSRAEGNAQVQTTAFKNLFEPVTAFNAALLAPPSIGNRGQLRIGRTPTTILKPLTRKGFTNEGFADITTGVGEGSIRTRSRALVGIPKSLSTPQIAISQLSSTTPETGQVPFSSSVTSLSRIPQQEKTPSIGFDILPVLTPSSTPRGGGLFVPTPPGTPPSPLPPVGLPGLPFGLPPSGGAGGVLGGRSFRYTPDLTSTFFNIQGRTPSIITGLETRPKKRRKKR